MSFLLCCVPSLHGLPALPIRQQALLLPPSPTTANTEHGFVGPLSDDSHSPVDEKDGMKENEEASEGRGIVSREPSWKGGMKIAAPAQAHLDKARPSPRPAVDDSFAPPTPRNSSFSTQTSLHLLTFTVPSHASPSNSSPPCTSLTRATTAAASIAADYRARTRAPATGHSLPPLPRPPSFSALSALSAISVEGNKSKCRSSPGTPPRSRQCSVSRSPTALDAGKPFRVAGWSAENDIGPLHAPRAHFRGPSVHSSQSSLWGRLM